MKPFFDFLPGLPGSFFQEKSANTRIATVLILFLSLLTLLSLWMGETEVTLAALGAILSLAKQTTEATGNGR